MEQFKEYNKEILDKLAGFVENKVQNAQCISCGLVGEEFSEVVPLESMQEFGCVSNFFNAGFNDNEDKNLKKIIAACGIFAKNEGVISLPEKFDTPFAIAAAVDEGLNQAKIAYKVAVGEIDVDEVLDNFIDFGAARACAAIDMAVPFIKQYAELGVEKAVPMIVDAICMAVEVAYPSATTIMEFLKGFTPFITEKVKVVVKKGIDIVAPYAKDAVKLIADNLKVVGHKVTNWIKDIIQA